ncbi:biotin/lipoate--protein ligase family protein [Oceanibaculum pacificum]|uniref:BPL/LPL catalytic domain-containing protein n=1 Tax=Oceanibaculum pacificum TaxID=580166 RepID=A0A154VWZ9_9PROT|nr:biotin/lipoate--protein ligase family protein [Oceanibaculum pacificum]KZD05810.1 hypothetical protein AUP43_02540 [Oceanibaculum pacificum]
MDDHTKLILEVSAKPLFPPVYASARLPAAADALEAAVTAAKAGADPATFFWVDREDRLEAAIVLQPEQALEQALPILHVGMIGIGDALGALVPPQMAVTFGWPDRLEANGGLVGGLRLAAPAGCAPDAVPDWLVLGLTILVQRRLIGGEEPGMDPTRTALHEEGCGELTVPDILEAFSRHFLLWVNRFEEEGPRPCLEHWLERGTDYSRSTAVTLRDSVHAGTFIGLDDQGGMLLKTETVQALPLATVLAGPSWSL